MPTPDVTPTVIVTPSSSVRVAMEAGNIASKLGASRQLSAGVASANTALTDTCTRVSLCAVGGDIRYQIGVGAQTALATSHFLGERDTRDIAVLPGSHIAVMRAGSVSAVLELSELS